MSKAKTEGFYLWRCLPEGQIVKAGALAIKQLANGRLEDIQFKYDPAYLSDKNALALDPINAPLLSDRQDYETAGHQLPGFIDDCLPDNWGRRIVAARLGVRHVDTLTLMTHLSGSAIGALKIIPASTTSVHQWPGGVPYKAIAAIVDAVWQGDWQALSHADHDLALLLTGGSRLGGARPKLSVNENGQEWLIKFNRSQDSFDMAAAEWACLQLLNAAGLSVAKAEIGQLGERRYLKVKRFDISPSGGRYHLLTCNALLKDPHTQDDPHHASYEDIANLIRRYSVNPIRDLEQLLGQLLVNSAVSNTDDHLRNFSLLHDANGWRLSPAYDIVPAETLDTYHQLSLAGKQFLPGANEAEQAGKALGIGKAASKRIGDQVRSALEQWPELLAQTETDGASYKRLAKILR